MNHWLAADAGAMAGDGAVVVLVLLGPLPQPASRRAATESATPIALRRFLEVILNSIGNAE